MSERTRSFNPEIAIPLIILGSVLACQPTQTKPSTSSPAFVLVQPSLISAPPLPVLVDSLNGNASLVIEVVVDPTGRPSQTRLVSGPDSLYKLSINWLQGLVFKPGNLNGQNFHFRVKVTIEYSRPTSTYKVEIPSPNGRWS